MVIVISPAWPTSVVSTEIFPSPVICIFSGALISIFPPLPVDVVRAEMKPWSMNVILMFGSVLLLRSGLVL